MSKTHKTNPNWWKVANAPQWAKVPFHISSCDGNCGIEFLNADQYRKARSNTGIMKPMNGCRIYLDPAFVDRKMYAAPPIKWGVKIYNRRERSKVRDVLTKIKKGQDLNDPEPYRGRSRNKWDMS